MDPLDSDCPSLEYHAFNILRDGQQKISKQGLGKRFNASSVKFLQALLGYCFQEKWLFEDGHLAGLPSKFTAIRVMDSTEFKLPPSLCEAFPGYSGSGKLQPVRKYNLNMSC